MRPLSGSSLPRGVAVVLAILAAVGSSTAAHAQGVWEALLTIDPYPSPYYSDWEVDPAMGTLTVVNHGMAEGRVRVAFSIVDGANRVIASGTSDPQPVPPGGAAIFDSPYEVAGTSRHDAEIERIAERTGRLPEGGYTACAAALDLDGFILAEACAAFTILYPDPPLLLAPGEGVVVDRQDELFQWTPVQVPVAFQPRYVLRIVEVLDGQMPGEALESNIPHHESFELFSPNLQYPIEASPFEAGKQYAWSIRAFDQNGYALSANEGQSEIWTFRYDDGTGPPRPVGDRTLTLLNQTAAVGPAAADGGPGVAEADASGAGPSGLERLCELWDDPPAALALGLDIARGFTRGEKVLDVELFRDDVDRSWGLFGELSGREYLVVGDCDLGGEDGGLRWIATRKPDRRQPLTDFLERVVDEIDPDGVGDLVLEDGVIILAVRSDTAQVPTDWGRASAMTGGRSIEVAPGLTLAGVLSLPEHGMGSFFERLGYTEKELELRGSVTMEEKWSVGASVGQPASDSLEGKVDATTERKWVTLRGLLPSRPVRIASDFFQDVQWGVEITVKSSMKAEASTDASSPAVTSAGAVGIAPFVELSTVGGRTFKGELVVEGKYSRQPLRALMTPTPADSAARSDSSASSGFDLETPVLKLGSDARLTLGRSGFTVGCPVIEVKVDSGFVDGFREGPSALDWSVKLEGALENAGIPSVAKLSMEIGRHATRPGPGGAAGLSKMDSIRANITRLEGELEDADSRGATAEGDRIARDLAIERNALAMWEAQGRDTPRDSASGAPAERSPWHWTARITQESAGLGAGCSGAPARTVGFADLLAALAPGSGDLPDMEIPSDFLGLEEVVVTADATGRIVATGITRVGTAYTRLLLTYDREGEGGITVGLKPQRWSITEAIPALSGPVLDGVDFSNVALVVAQGDRDAASNELIPEEWVFYREVYQADDFSLTLRPGVNLIAAIPAAELGADNPLNMVMEALGIEQGVVLLQGTLGRSLGLIGGGAPGLDVIEDLYLRAELPPMRPPGSPEWFRSGQLALELTGDPSVRLVGEMTVRIEDDELLFFLAAALARTGVSLSGGLAAEEGWNQPFGISWLVMNGVVVKVGITPAGSIQLGFAGDMVIGEKDMAVAVAVALNAATGVPTNFIIEGESEAGFGLSDLVMLQSRMAAARGAAASSIAGADSPDSAEPAIPLDALPSVDFRDIGLKFAPKPEPDLGVERGMAIQGRLWLPLSADGDLTDFAGVDVAVSEDGLWARGDLGAFELGPLVWQDAELDLTATRDDQHFLVKGEVELLGSRQLVDVSFAQRSFSFRTETRIHDLFTADISAVSEFDLRSPAFQVDAVAQADFGDLLGPLVQAGVARYAETGEEALATARSAADAAGAVLARSEATLAELQRVLEAQRQTAARAREAALADANGSRSAMNAALAARSRAYRSYRSTPARQVRLKAQRLAAYRAAHRTYLIRAAAYSAVYARFATADRVYRAIPPTDERVAVMTAAEAVARVREQLTTMQSNLTAMESQYRRITDVLARGGQLLRIERAEFHAGLEAAQRGEAVQWRIRGAFAEEPFEVEEVLDFSNVGAGAAGLVGALLYR